MKKYLLLLLILPTIFVSCSKKYATVDQEVSETLKEVKESIEDEDYREVIEKLSLKINQFSGTRGVDSLVYFLGVSYIELEEFESGAIQLRRFSDNFRISPLRPSAQYYIAQSYVRRLPIASRYQDITNMALRELNFFTELYPEHTLMKDVKKDIRTCRNLLAKSAFDIGYFYFRKDEFSPARAHFSDVIASFIDTDISDDARLMLSLSYLKLSDMENSKNEFELVEKNKVSDDFKSFYSDVEKGLSKK